MARKRWPARPNEAGYPIRSWETVISARWAKLRDLLHNRISRTDRFDRHRSANIEMHCELSVPNKCYRASSPVSYIDGPLMTVRIWLRGISWQLDYRRRIDEFNQVAAKVGWNVVLIWVQVDHRLVLQSSHLADEEEKNGKKTSHTTSLMSFP